MNEHSLLCQFLAEHPTDWEVLLTKDYSIKIKKEGDLAIFNYGFECRFSEPLVQEARGIILNTVTREVVCWPFRKFGNHNESYADPIDWSTARVLEKVDGSIIKLWYDHTLGKWQFSTNGTIRAEKAPIERYVGLFYGAVIERADNYADIPFERLDRHLTYIFELVSPETRVVVPYAKASLYHIGTRNNLTGLECEVDIGIQMPKSYALSSLDECLAAAVELNATVGSAERDDLTGEGFVVVDGNWNRVKVKSPDYLVQHRLRQINDLSARDCITMLLEGDGRIDVICKNNPHLLPLFKYYDFKLAELRYQADKLGLLAKSLYLEYSGDRGAVARVISRHRLAWVGFLCLDSEVGGGEILLGSSVEKIVKLIPDYKPEQLYSLFLGDGKNET